MECEFTPELEHYLCVSLCSFFFWPLLPRYGQEPHPILVWHGSHLPMDVSWTLFADILLSILPMLNADVHMSKLALALCHADGMRALYDLYIEVTQHLLCSLLTVEQLLLYTLILVLLSSLMVVQSKETTLILETSAEFPRYVGRTEVLLEDKVEEYYALPDVMIWYRAEQNIARDGEKVKVKFTKVTSEEWAAATPTEHKHMWTDYHTRTLYGILLCLRFLNLRHNSETD